MKAEKFEHQFDDGLDVTASLDLSKAKRVLQTQKRVNVDFPTWMIDSLDREASKLGVTRQSVIKVWLAGRRLNSRGVKGGAPRQAATHGHRQTYTVTREQAGERQPSRPPGGTSKLYELLPSSPYR